MVGLQPAQKPAEGRPQRAAAGLATLAAEADGGWAAWDTSEAPQATTQASSRATPPPPSDAAALVAATGLVDEWDAFQSGSAPQDGPTPRSSDDPFASSGVDLGPNPPRLPAASLQLEAGGLLSMVV